MNGSHSVGSTVLAASLTLGVCVPLGAAQCPNQSWNGYCPETVPRQGEQRLNRFQWIGSHNAFQRVDPDGDYLMPLSEQLDEYGHRYFEIDIRWDETLNNGNGGWKVQHNCIDLTGRSELENHLVDIASSDALYNSFIFLDFQINKHNAFEYNCFDVLPSTVLADLKNTLIAYIPEDYFYTGDDYIEIDNRRWPSQQELLRRGKHVAVTTASTHTTGTGNDYSFYFDTVDGDPNLANGNSALITSGGEFQQYDLGDSLVSEFYPTGGTCQNDPAWSIAVDSGYTFPTKYCLAKADDINDARIHPPNPIHVSTVALLAGPQFGTRDRPFAGGVTGLYLALARIAAHEAEKGPSHQTIDFEPGVYDVPGQYRFPMPVTLKARTGVVQLR